MADELVQSGANDDCVFFLPKNFDMLVRGEGFEDGRDYLCPRRELSLPYGVQA